MSITNALPDMQRELSFSPVGRQNPKKLTTELSKYGYKLKNDQGRWIINNEWPINIKISKLAQGLPVGGEIEFLDDGTLFSAFKNRNSIATD